MCVRLSNHFAPWRQRYQYHSLLWSGGSSRLWFVHKLTTEHHLPEIFLSNDRNSSQGTLPLFLAWLAGGAGPKISCELKGFCQVSWNLMRSTEKNRWVQPSDEFVYFRSFLWHCSTWILSNFRTLCQWLFLYTWPIPGHTTWEDISPLLVLDEFAQEAWAKRMAKRELQELQFKRGKYWKTHSSVAGLFAFVALALLDGLWTLWRFWGFARSSNCSGSQWALCRSPCWKRWEFPKMWADVAAALHVIPYANIIDNQCSWKSYDMRLTRLFVHSVNLVIITSAIASFLARLSLRNLQSWNQRWSADNNKCNRHCITRERNVQRFCAFVAGHSRAVLHMHLQFVFRWGFLKEIAILYDFVTLCD